ncbi:hypothetical protein ONZ45_g7977 [Pleurotus djamor]|nr:hypothetical protein ONZ45_g7977 [Pleurotus djamor]
MASDLSKKPRAKEDDDDLEDIDDVISQFAPTGKTDNNAAAGGSSKVTASGTAPLPTTTATRVGPTRPRHNTRVEDAPPTQHAKATGGGLEAPAEEDEIADAFARELSKGMESLMRELVTDNSSDPDKGEGAGEADEETMKKAWEAMLVEGMNGLMDPENVEAGSSKPSQEFQSKIRQTMHKMKEQDEGEATEEFEKLMKEFTSSLKGEGGDNEEELAGFIETMMSQLMSKDILHDPLKELGEKLPVYIKENSSKLPKADVERYELQLAAVRKIVSVFDDPGYDENDTQTQVKVVEMMTEMQSYGSPPQELMGDLPTAFGQEGAPPLPEGCTIA